GKFAETVSRVRWIYLTVPCVLYLLGLLISSIKLQWLLGGYRMRIALHTAFDLNWIAGFYNNFLPTSIGADLYRIYYLNRMHPQHPAEGVSVVILDRGLGLLAMLIFGGMVGLFFIRALVSTTWIIGLLYSTAVFLTLASFFVLFVEHDLRLSHTSRFTIVNKL